METTAAPEAVATPNESEITPAKAREMIDAQKGPTKTPEKESISEIAKEVIRKHKLKVDGEEIEVDDNELKRGYTHQRAANKKMQEGLAARKQAEQFIDLLKDPDKFFAVAKQLGHDPRNLSEKYLAAILEDELLDPKDKELKEVRSLLKEKEDLEKAREKEVQDKRDAALKDKYAKEYSEQFVAALEQTGLPPTKEMVGRMAKYIAEGAKAQVKMTALEAAKLVEEDVLGIHRRLVASAEGDKLIKLLGDDVANKIRKYDTSKLRDPESGLKTPEEQGEKKRVRSPSGRMSHKEWREYNRSR